MAESKKGLHDGEPLKDVVDTGAYPERPYHEAVSDEHKAWLADREVKVTKTTTEDPTLSA